MHELVHVVLWPLDMAAMDLVEAIGSDGSPAREFARSAVFRALEPERSNWRWLCSGHRGLPVWTVLEQEAAQRANSPFGDIITASLFSDLG